MKIKGGTMSNTNIVIFTGNLTANGEQKKVVKNGNEIAVLTFSVALNRNYKDKEGNKVSETTYVNNLALFNKPAEALAPYMLKGTKVCVTGHFVQNIFEKEGSKISTLEIRPDKVELLSKPLSNGDPAAAEESTDPADDYVDWN